MIKKLQVAYIHTPNKELADWYAENLGLKKAYGDNHWQLFAMEEGSDFALDFVGYPSSTVQKQSIMLSFEVDDIYLAIQELTQKGVRFYPNNDPKQIVFDVGSTLVATLEDPDGNYVQLSQKKTLLDSFAKVPQDL